MDTKPFTYQHQPDNVGAWRMGEACRKAADAPAGDYIDRGLVLLNELQAKGYGIVALAALPTDAAQARTGRLPWQSVIDAIYAVDTESSRRGEMFPQTGDEQRDDRHAVKRVCEMIRWYATKSAAGIESFIGWPTIAAPVAPAATIQRHSWTVSGMKRDPEGSWVLASDAGAGVPAAAAPMTTEQRKALADAERVLGENWEHETADRLHDAFAASTAAAPIPAEQQADWRGDFERQARVGGFDLSREELGGNYSNDRSSSAWLWYYSGRLDGECGAAPTHTVAADAAQADERAAFDAVKPLVDEWIRSRGTCMDGGAYAAALQLAAHVKARVTAPQAGATLTDEQILRLWRFDHELPRDAAILAFAHTLLASQLSTETVDKPVQSMSGAACDVLAERARQVNEEGWTPEHDDQHEDFDMALAAIVYAESAVGYHTSCPDTWPWSPAWFKPTAPRRDFVKAGALILAEIERLDRAAQEEPKT
ncbi:hypothetical protein ACFSHT_15675 [Paraburkholderia silviterrae]|uniref:Uncharacterized protein n=1 Tax=Paraburkholderia silviterrae TaxID=2528715 RepID=A0A4R5M9G6_9BURK|nr:hypothetical protein [Paraburkholderia silviterrae]TDG23267.1 hypothetical protein EYW47_15155 [Paraburkholderia silviterrae]